MGLIKGKSYRVLLAFCIIIAISVGMVGPVFAQSSSDTVKVLITFNQKPSLMMKKYLELYGVESKYDYTITPTISANVPRNQIKMIGSLSGVVSVEYDARVWALDDDTLPWGVDRIDAEIVHSYNKGTGVKVAVIDSGIDLDHTDLNVLGGRRFYNQGSEDTNYDDDNGHGTHVAGTIAALDNGIGVVGVAPEVHLYSVKVLGANGGGYWSDVIKGIQWATVNDMDVINMSLGGSSASTALENACNAAEAAGIVVVAAAGNNGNSYTYSDNVIYPAKYNSVIAVAATDSSDKRASFSSTGPAVELAAPGVNIYSTCNGGGYCTKSGTSMASPHAAGLAALVIASGVSDTNGNGRINDEVRQILRNTADDLGTPGWDSQYGYGIIDADGAVSGPANNAPVAVNDSYGTDEDTNLVISAPGVLGNDSDADNDSLQAINVAGPSHGSLTLNADGSFNYTPIANYNGGDSFTYKAYDGKANSNVATVTVTVNPVNDSPVAVNDSYGVGINITLQVPAKGVLVNDNDIDGDLLTATLINDVSNGTLNFNSNGSFSYAPDTDFEGVDIFTYQAYDGSAYSNIATVTITVSYVNYAPAAVNDVYNVNEDNSLTVPASFGVLANDYDPNGDPLQAIQVTAPAHGSLTLYGNGSFNYTPNLNYNGGDSFTYKANDGEFDSNIAIVNITVNSVNDAPVAAADAYTMTSNHTLTVPAPGVLSNDSDVDHNPLNAVLVTGVGQGRLTLNLDGSFVYTPGTGYEGQDSFTYNANDGFDDSNVVTVTISVSGIDPATLMHVKSIDMTLVNTFSGLYKNGSAKVTIVDGNGALVSSAKVSGHWQNATRDTDIGTTNSSGFVTLSSDRVWKPAKGTTFVFIVDNVQKSSLTYNPDANVETSDSVSVP